MKKEKIVLTDEEKMKKSFKSFGNIAKLVEDILIAGPIIILVLAAILSISIFVGEKPENTTENTVVQDTQAQDISFNDVLNDITDGAFKEYEEMPVVFKIVKIICLIATFIIHIIILDNLKNMFIEISQDAKPFTEKNVKRLNNISWLTFALLFISELNIGLITVICIFALNKVFKYGYKLQIESDETL